MSTINCLNCDAPITIISNSKYIKCEYCKSLNSNFSSLDNIDDLLKETDSSENPINDILINYKLKDYNSLRKICQTILNNNPDSWVALIYNAVADFWLGYDDFSHLDAVKKSILKAKLLSKENELVIDTANKIANNIVLLGAKNDEYGEDFQNAIRAFYIAFDISLFDDDTKTTLYNYLHKSFIYQKNKLNDLLNKSKSDYDPPYISLQNLYEICKLTNTKEYYEYYYLHSKIHIKKCKSKSYYDDFMNNVKNIEKQLIEMKSDVVGKCITFNFLGKIIIK